MRICVSIFVTDEASALRAIASAAEAGADLVELRIDRIADPALVGRLVRACPTPTLLTCRSRDEGGEADLDDPARLDLLRAAGEGPGLIDVEYETLRRFPSFFDDSPRPLIASSHHFAGRPDRLYNLFAEMGRTTAIPKLVWTARTIRDNLEAFELLRLSKRPAIVFCMGEAGVASRILARKFGAYLTFASLDEASATAPGQLSIHTLKRLYRWDRIGPRTRVYGVVARPVAHSMSPAVHNAAFDAVGFDGVYLPLLVEDSYESFKAFMETFLAAEGLDLSGLSITIPHKHNALRYLDERGAKVEPLARTIGAVNTIGVRRDESGAAVLEGRNTDYAAILDSITEKLGIDRHGLAGRRVAVLGAGGAGRAAVAALAHHGATVVVYNRTPERARQLAEEFNGHSGKVVAAGWEKICDTCCEVIINTTSVGMHPQVDQSPLGDGPVRLGPRNVVFDTVYNPVRTRLLEQAEAAGAATINGVEMFVRQAAAQFEMWTGLAAPTRVMRQAIERRLGA